MGRLIDADKLREGVLKWMPPDPCGQEEKEYPLETDIVASMMMTIEDAETIKAIPEEWINDHVAWLESMDADVAGSDARAIKVMLTKWKMEQENAGGCSADACPIKF